MILDEESSGWTVHEVDGPKATATGLMESAAPLVVEDPDAPEPPNEEESEPGFFARIFSPQHLVQTSIVLLVFGVVALAVFFTIQAIFSPSDDVQRRDDGEAQPNVGEQTVDRPDGLGSKRISSGGKKTVTDQGPGELAARSEQEGTTGAADGDGSNRAADGSTPSPDPASADGTKPIDDEQGAADATAGGDSGNDQNRANDPSADRSTGAVDGSSPASPAVSVGLGGGSGGPPSPLPIDPSPASPSPAGPPIGGPPSGINPLPIDPPTVATTVPAPAGSTTTTPIAPSPTDAPSPTNGATTAAPATTATTTAPTTAPTTPATTATTAPPATLSPPPAALIASPANGSTIQWERSSQFRANAVPGATRYCWQFQSAGPDSQKCGSSTTYDVPARRPWTGPGPVTVTAQAFDSANNVLLSQTLNVNFTAQNVIRDPSAGREIDQGKRITLRARFFPRANNYCWTLSQGGYNSGEICSPNERLRLKSDSAAVQSLNEGPVTIQARVYSGGNVVAEESTSIVIDD